MRDFREYRHYINDFFFQKKDNACKVDREMLHTRKMNLNTTKLGSVSSVYKCVIDDPPYYFDFSQVKHQHAHVP